MPLPVQHSPREPEPTVGSTRRGPLDNLVGPKPSCRPAPDGRAHLGTIRRRIESFTVNKSQKLTPPATGLVKKLTEGASGLVKQDAGGVDTAVKAQLKNEMVKPIDSPRQLTVDIKPEAPTTHPKRRSMEHNIGQIGGDEFFIRTGIRQSFEGGHLVGHQFWDEKDDDAKSAGDYVNLLPMSRTLNVNAYEGWKTAEAKLDRKITDLRGRPVAQKARFTITVENGSEQYNMSLGEICTRFGLTLKKPADAARTISLDRWLPGIIKSSWANLDTDSESEFPDAQETVLHNLGTPIETDQELVAAIQISQLWGRMSPEMKKKYT